MRAREAADWPKTWLPYARADSVAPVRMFCFAHSGGGASTFLPWRSALAPTVQVCGVQLPGRESRRAEIPYSTMDALVDGLVPALAPLIAHSNRRYALFGHSMGADVAYAVARRLRAEGLPPPLRLLVAAHRPPHLAETDVLLHPLGDREFIARLSRYEGTDPAVWENPELVELLLPALRADFAVFERFQARDDEPVDCPISVFGGADDLGIPFDALQQWRRLTRSSCSVRLFRGAHFFLEGSLAEVAKAVSADLSGDLIRQGR